MKICKRLLVLPALILVPVLYLSACSSNDKNDDFEIPPHIVDKGKAANAFRIMAYNIAVFDRDPNDRDNYQTIANMVNEKEADVVFLNELDSCTSRTKYVYQLEKFAGIMNWDFKYAGAIPYKGGSYGEGLATKQKIKHKYSVALPKGDGAEARVLVVAELENCVVATTHLDHSNPAAHKAQAELITKTMLEKYKDSGKAIFLGGDMNALPTSETMKLLEKDWKILSVTVPTFPSHAPKSCIDYVMILKNGMDKKVKVLHSEVPRWFKTGNASTSSDHLPVIVDVDIDTLTN